MNEKQQQLLFDKGITNVPSDALCSDNTLAESVGLVYVDGEHKVIQKPENYITSAVGIDSETPISIKLLYVHKFNGTERFIATTPTTTQQVTYDILIWGVKTGSVFSQKGTFIINNAALIYDATQISTIGKTLILADSKGLHYYLWTKDSQNDDIYDYLGDTFPRPEVEFKLTGRNNKDYKEQIATYDMLYNISTGKYGITLNRQQDWNNAIVGLYAGLRKKVWQDKKFHGSFCVRAALELYDGSYYHISNPIFMVNHFSAYGVARIYDEDRHLVTMHIYGQELKYKFNQDFTKWSDIIKNVVLFVTKEANIFDTTVDATCYKGQARPTPTDPDLPNSPVSYFISGNTVYQDSTTLGSSPTSEGDIYRVLASIPDSDLDNTLKEGVYYKLCEIGLYGDNTWHNSGDNFDTHTIENIETYPQLGEDDYYSHCPIKAGLLYSYNSRLNIANVSRGFFNGFDNFMPFVTPLGGTANPSSAYTFHTTIRTDGGDVIVSQEKTTDQIQGIYFYYPDARAKHVNIWKGTKLILDANLIEHPTLNGSYYFAGISPTMLEPSGTASSIPDVTTSSELLPNYIIQSEVNNPFVFKAAGYFKVGTGKILGMSSITQALSEGQFGQFPLLVFSESGIWSLSVASTGYYDSAHPMSREVSYDPACLVQTDGAVFFTSKKGLMVVVGNQVKCVSDQLSSKTNVFKDGSNNSLVIDLGNFSDYLKNAFIAYDYRDSLLWIFNTAYTTCYIYSMKTGTFSKFTPTTKITSIVNNYPDYLLQAGTTIYSLTERKDINASAEQSNSYAAAMLTRPLKLEDALALKSIMQVKHIHDINTSATLTLRIFASNNLKDWIELTSLKSVPWKYYRFRYDFTNLIATDRFAGTMLITQERRTNKLR